MTATLAPAARGAPPAAAALPNPFRAALTADGATVFAVELVPTARRLDRIYRFAESVRTSDATLFLTDGAGGHSAPSPDPIAADLARLTGRQPVVTIACKWSSRDALLGRIAALDAQGIENVLVVSGDYPRAPSPPHRGGFPLDAVSLLLAAKTMPVPRRGGAWFGAAVCPFKYTEADVWGQRIKTWKKWHAGASYFVTQIGFDVRKLHELRLWMARDGMGRVPALASVHVLHAATARLLRGGRLPGVYLPPDLDALASPPGASPGRMRRATAQDLAAAHRRAALLADVAVRGLGYRGVLFGGLDDFDELRAILTIKDELSARDWRESLEEYRDPAAPSPDRAGGRGTRKLRFAPDGGFYLFSPGDDGLLIDGPEQTADRSAYARPPLSLRLIHRLLFRPGSAGAALTAHVLHAAQRGGLASHVDRLEHAAKRSVLGCELCGDCRISALGFRCPEPEQGCPKGLLNGPCAGSTPDGWCEADPSRQCYWRRVVEGALAEGELGPLYLAQLPRDPALRGSSSWINHFAGRTPRPVALTPGAARPPTR